MSDYTGWYKFGTITAVKGSKEIIGDKTYWNSAGLNRGDIVKINGTDYELDSVTDDTHLTLAEAYGGESVSGGKYAIVRNFTATPMSRTVANISEILRTHQLLLDEKLKVLTGKSAYQIAQDHGYTGTEEEWLESLLAAGEITQIYAALEEKADKADVEGVVNLFSQLGLYVDEDGDLAQEDDDE